MAMYSDYIKQTAFEGERTIAGFTRLDLSNAANAPITDITFHDMGYSSCKAVKQLKYRSHEMVMVEFKLRGQKWIKIFVMDLEDEQTTANDIIRLVKRYVRDLMFIAWDKA